MNGFSDFAKEAQLDTDAIHHILRYYLAVKTDDLDEEEMLRRLIDETGDEDGVYDALRRLQGDTALMEMACLEVLHEAYRDSTDAMTIESAARGAKETLAVIETAILAIVAMYGMYLLCTGGKAIVDEEEDVAADRSIKRTRKTIYADPTDPLGMIVGLFRRRPPKG